MLVGKCPCGKRGEANTSCPCGSRFEASERDYAAALRRMMETASEADGDTTCTVDGMHWHCIWCGEPVSGSGHEHCTFRKEPTAALLDDLDGLQVDGWTCHWEYPGFLSWTRPDRDYDVVATPDFDGNRGKIDVQANKIDGSSGGCGPLVPYTSSPLTAAEYLELVIPFLGSDPASKTWQADDALREWGSKYDEETQS